VLFRAEASRHLSMDERSEKPLERLTVLYPDRLEFAERLANLYRSIDFSYYHEDRKLTEKGVGVFLREISLFPTVDTLYVQLGEMLVEANRYEKAKEEWLKRIDLYPGLEKSYLNVATILWDYYDFEDAAEIIKKGRAIFGSDTMLSREMAVIYEELKDYGNAIKEYINASLGGEYYYYEREEVIYRLQYLAKTYGLGKLIQKTFMEAIQANDEPDRIVSVYANYLERQGMYEEKLKMYAEALPFLRDPYRIREILNELEATDRSVLVVDYALRLVEITEEIDDYLLLASTYENQKNLSKSKSVYENMLKMFEGEDNEARRIMSNYSEFLWRNGEHARALDMLFRAQEISKGYTRESILSDLAYRALSVNDYKRAQRAFGLLLQEDPYNVNYFNLAGDMYQKLGDAGELEKVYLEKIKVIEKSPLGYAIKRERTEALYLGLARRLKELKKKTRAQDYYIEAINRDPQNTSLLDEVYTFSKKENMVERLIQYYEMTAEKSFKDYRWQMVLVRFHMREGNLDNAIAQLGNAVTNQPQLAYLHEELADVLAVQGRYEEAIDAYEAAYVLTKGKSSITEKIALIYLRMGEKEKMFRKFDELIHSKPEGARKYFEVSAICLAYGLDEEAFQYAHRGRESLEAYPYKDYLSDDMLSTLSEAYLKRGRAEQLMRFLANQYKRYHSDTEKEESYARSEAYTRSSRIRYFISSTLGLIWNDFATDGDRQYLSEEFNGFSAFPYYSDIVRAYIQFAARAEVPGVTERVLLAQYEADKLKTSYPSLYEITNFYESRGAFEKLYRFLGRESRDHARIAMLARIVAPEEELAWLRKFYDESVQNYRRYGSTFYGYSPVIERYLDLLVSKGMDHELDGLLVSAASCNGQLLNYFFRRADGRRAFGIIDGGFPNKNGLWKKAKKAYVSFNLGYRKDEGVGYFKEILDIRPIGEKLERTPEEVLFGRDFYVNSFFFGEQDSSYLFAGIEAAPRSSGSFQHLGEYLAERERYGSAKDYLEKAMELSPTHEIYLSLAKTYLKLRDKNRALEVLKNMDGDDFYRKVQYINALMDVGFRKEAEEILAGYLRKHIDTMSYSDTRQGLALTKKVMHDREAFLKELAKLVVSNESFYSTVLAERKVDDIGFYIKRYMGLVEKGRARKDFYRRETFVERLFNEELYTEALELILVTEEGISEDSLPDWIIPRKAEIYIRMDRSGDGVKLLEGYIKRREYIPNSNEVLRVLDLAEGDGLELKRYVYEFLIGSGWSNMANYLGLAETYLEMERKEQAIETLNELAVRNEYGYRELFEIAKLLFAHRQFEQSAAFLEKAMMANPGLVEGRLLKAKLLIEQGSVQNGSELALEIISERNPQEVKGQAYLILERCGETALSLVERRILDGGSEALYIARARLLSSLNRKEEAISTLSDCLAEFPYASSAVHQQLAELLDDARSVEYLYRALYLRGDSQETILDLLLTLMELKRDDETAMLISRSDIDPSNYLGWYDRESAKDQYLSKVDYLISDTQEQLSPREREKMLLEVLSSTAAFYERREDYRAAEFIIESVFSLKKDDKLMKKVVELGMKAEEMEKESRFVIQEDIANGEPF
jgi:tetratricopeptide (TPR) repeat protein